MHIRELAFYQSSLSSLSASARWTPSKAELETNARLVAELMIMVSFRPGSRLYRHHLHLIFIERKMSSKIFII